LYSLHFPGDPLGIIVYLIGLIVLWFVVSIPVYFAGKAVKAGNATFGEAMGATLGGVIAYYIVFFIIAYFLGAVIGSSAAAVALVLGLIVWLAVFKSAFHTSWLGAIGIVVLAWLILLILDAILVAAFGVSFPNFFPF
jgi:hypothetical protein